MRTALVLITIVISYVNVIYTTSVTKTTETSLQLISAIRNEGESFEQAAGKYNAESRMFDDTPFNNRQPMNDLNIVQVSDVDSSELGFIFCYIRDTRLLQVDTTFPRRISWLYPDDGCYVRAEVAHQELVATGSPVPNKLFVFGNLEVDTCNHPRGKVRWWYHVAVVYRVGDALYVIDPAISPARHLTLVEWNNVMGGQSEVFQYAICSAGTYGPHGQCAAEALFSDTYSHQDKFLTLEYSRLVELGRNPTEELGDHPPWQ